MNLNLGKNDRILRTIVGIVLVVAALRKDSWMLALLGVALMATAYLAYCPGYAMLKIRTDGKDNPA